MFNISGLERSPGGGHGNPLQCSYLESPMDRGARQATVCGSAPRNPEGRHPPAVREQLPTPQSTGCAPARGGQTPHYIAVSKSRKPASGTSSEVLKRGLKGQLQGWQQASDPVSKGPEPRAEADTREVALNARHPAPQPPSVPGRAQVADELLTLLAPLGTGVHGLHWPEATTILQILPSRSLKMSVKCHELL